MQTLEHANKTKQTMIPGYWIYIMMLILSTKSILYKMCDMQALAKKWIPFANNNWFGNIHDADFKHKNTI